MVLTNQFRFPKLDLKDETLHNPDLVLFADVLASHVSETSKNMVGYAVVTSSEVVKLFDLISMHKQ